MSGVPSAQILSHSSNHLSSAPALERSQGLAGALGPPCTWQDTAKAPRELCPGFLLFSATMWASELPSAASVLTDPMWAGALGVVQSGGLQFTPAMGAARGLWGPAQPPLYSRRTGGYRPPRGASLGLTSLFATVWPVHKVCPSGHHPNPPLVTPQALGAGTALPQATGCRACTLRPTSPCLQGPSQAPASNPNATGGGHCGSCSPHVGAGHLPGPPSLFHANVIQTSRSPPSMGTGPLGAPLPSHSHWTVPKQHLPPGPSGFSLPAGEPLLQTSKGQPEHTPHHCYKPLHSPQPWDTTQGPQGDPEPWH